MRKCNQVKDNVTLALLNVEKFRGKWQEMEEMFLFENARFTDICMSVWHVVTLKCIIGSHFLSFSFQTKFCALFLVIMPDSLLGYFQISRCKQ